MIFGKKNRLKSRVALLQCGYEDDKISLIKTEGKARPCNIYACQRCGVRR